MRGQTAVESSPGSAAYQLCDLSLSEPQRLPRHWRTNTLSHAVQRVARSAAGTVIVAPCDEGQHKLPTDVTH